MIEHMHALLLVVLEMIFIFSVLALLFNQRRTIGMTPFFTAIGALLFFEHLLSAAEITVVLPGPLSFPIAGPVCYLPVLVAYLMVYIAQGTLFSQRFVIAAIALYGLSLYLSEVTRMQCNWMGFSLTSGISGATLDYLLNSGRAAMNASAIGHLVDFFVVPIAYTRLRKWKFPVFFAALSALVISLLATMLPQTVVHIGTGLHTAPPIGEWLATAAGIVLLSAFLSLYLAKLEAEITSESRRPLDIFFAFLGGYRRAQELEADLAEWENRYQTILQNADVMIVLLEPDGTVADANRTAAELLASGPGVRLTGGKLPDGLEPVSPKNFSFWPAPPKPTICRTILKRGGETRVLELSAAPLALKKRTLSLLIGRDITDALKRDEQLAHAQRLDSLGMLAGGVAHDFNNYIHAILGHSDVITMMCDIKDPEIRTHLEKITEIAEKAAKLTNELLGFARRGKYTESEIDLESLIRECVTLLGPLRTANIEFNLAAAPGRWLTRGDTVQLRQVIVNLMLNAVDAMSENQGIRRLDIRIDRAENFPLGATLPDNADPLPGPRIGIEITDNGCGMDEAIRKRIFEPFFTTKPVGVGTGMGLSMVYGTIHHHHGWIKVKSAKGRGTTFCIVLPLATHKEGLS